MKIKAVKKMCTRICASASVMSILLLPVQAADIVPVPVQKPALLETVLVPVPEKKPGKIQQIKEKKRGFATQNLNLASLFSIKKHIKKPVKKKKQQYSHGYSVLSASDASLYKRAFEAQALGKMNIAGDMISKIKDNQIQGHILFQRYMHASYKSTYDELKNWMATYADHPQASIIYKLALSKKVNNDDVLLEPKNGRMLSQMNEPMIYYPKRYVSNIDRDKVASEQVRGLTKKIHFLIRKGQTLEALETFRNAAERDNMDSVEHDQLQTVIAQKLLFKGELDSALTLASQSADRSGKYVPLSGWVAGLVLWQQGDYARAATYFEKTGKSAYASGWLAAGGSFWAARSYRKVGAQVQADSALKSAAKHSRTFYGLMAMRALGKNLEFNWNVPKFTKEHEGKILAYQAGKRAFSLVAAQQYDLAEQELMRLNYKKDKSLRPAVLAYASYVGLPGVALRLGNMLKDENGKYYDSALYPVSPWTPEGGYKLDPALVHAVIRQESRFNLNAKSYSGAQGLMQIMPKTAQYIAEKRGYAETLNAHTVRQPETNMKLGQDYIEYLLDGHYVKDDVLSLLVAYNAGPGNLLKWRKRVNGSDQDPLLFVEMIPVKETRDYVERVLSNYWIYRHRAGLELPSLTALSQGKYPRYAHVMQAEYPYKIAANQ